MGRPKKDNARAINQTTRFSPAELAALSDRAQAAGYPSVSAYIRAILFEGLAAPTPAAVDQDGVEAAPALSLRAKAEALRHNEGLQEGQGAPVLETVVATLALAQQLRKVGVNLNQMVRVMNLHRSPPPPELVMVLADIRHCVRRALAT